MHASLRPDKFGDLALDGGGDVTFWFRREDGSTDLMNGDRRVLWRIDGSEVGGDDFLLCVNMDHVPVDFALPTPRAMKRWVRIIDTAAWAERQGNFWPVALADPMGSSYTVHPYALAVFQERQS